MKYGELIEEFMPYVNSYSNEQFIIHHIDKAWGLTKLGQDEQKVLNHKTHSRLRSRVEILAVGVSRLYMIKFWP